MSDLLRKLVVLNIVLLGLGAPLAACDDNDSTAENIGEAVEEAGDDAGDAIEDAGDAVEDAAE